MDADPMTKTDQIPPLSVRWRCFHCDATFTEHQAKWAREHFGRDEGETPVCQMRVPGESHLIAALRKAQDELASYRAEDAELMRAIESMESDYRQKLIREEEKGYARGLKDYLDVESRCHAAESEVARLRGENAEYHAELCRERTALEVEQVSHQSTLNLAAAQDAAAEQRIAILTAERDLARSNYEITHRNYAELNDWVTDYSTDERIAECVRLRAERDAALAAAREAASSGMRRSKFSAP